MIQSEAPLLSICIATRNRPNDLTKCLESLLLLNDYPYEVIVIDDASDQPIKALIENDLSDIILLRTKFIRQVPNKGASATRNQLSLEACSSYILFLDDDACLVDADSIYRSMNILQKDTSIGAVAFAQVDKTGCILPDFMQAAPVNYACYTQSFISCGVLLKRDLFVKLGGFKEKLGYYGEEKEYCKRLLNEGFSVVYLPEVQIMHSHSSTQRSELIRLRNNYRNSCFDAIYNEPLLMCIFSIPWRIFNYIQWRKVPCEYYGFSDDGGVKWLLNELYTNFFSIWQQRKPLKWLTYWKWLEIRKHWPAYNINNI